MKLSQLDPLSKEFFEEDIERFKDHLSKNEKLYDEIHEQLTNATGGGFSLGLSRNATEYAKTLATIRSNAITGTTQLFNAKKTIAELEFKKKQLELKQKEIEENKLSNEKDKDYFRSIIEAMHDSKDLTKEKGFTGKLTKKPIETIKGKDLMDSLVKEEIEKGEIKLSDNEKAFKYDFIGEGVEAKYDLETQSFVPVLKSTGEVLTDYPIERLNPSKVISVDQDKGEVFLENGKTIKIL